jgi:hypothetical protein
VIEAAQWEFERAMTDSDNLVAVHRATEGPGRRTREVSINRAIVVLTVAAWQAFVEDLVAEILEEIEVAPGDAGYLSFLTLRADARNAAHNFSTPNAENTRGLLMRLGFDPWSYWTWWEGPVFLTAQQGRERMNQWLKVRHAIAHGDAELPDVPVLATLADGTRVIHRANAEACMSYFRRIVDATTFGAREAFPEFYDGEDEV